MPRSAVLGNSNNIHLGGPSGRTSFGEQGPMNKNCHTGNKATRNEKGPGHNREMKCWAWLSASVPLVVGRYVKV